MKSKIFYTKPSITSLEIDYATDAATNGWGDQCYAYIDKFEQAFKQHLGVKYAIATSSCTGALTMGLAALNIGAGDEVILADSNWIATVSPVVHLGATPVFVDILADSWCIDPDLTEQAITKRTKAIIVTHLYGNICNMDRLLAIGIRYGIPIIEDAAQAIGSQWKGQHAGTLGKFGTFSFHGTKTLTTGEGGMFITNDVELYERVLTLSNHGRAKNQKKQFWPDEIGFKYKMSNIQAAIGCGQIERINELVGRKREIFKTYQHRLKFISGLSMNPEKVGTINSYWMPTVVFDKSTGITREKLLQLFADENIDARVFFYPLSSLSMFDDNTSNLNAWDLPNRAVNLPSYYDLKDSEVDRVVEVLSQFCKI